VSDAQRYDPKTNPGGVRCTLADYMINVFGKRPDGFAGRPLDDVGMQVGFKALMAGVITPAQFTDINAKFGGADIDAHYTPGRVVADQPALANAYRSGSVNETNNLRTSRSSTCGAPTRASFTTSTAPSPCAPASSARTGRSPTR
jgi:hypothetical protein